jgi:dUTP pyrophosphatase
MTVPPAEQPPSAKALQQHGYTIQTQQDAMEEPNELYIKLLSDRARTPVRATDASAGYDVYSPIDAVIAPGQRILIPLDIAATPPANTYLQIAPRSSLAAKHMIDTKAGVIDADFTGNITVVLHNSSTTAYNIRCGDRIAQLLVLPVQHPTIKLTEHLVNTNRAAQSFGSTGQSAVHRTCATEIPELPFDIYLSLDSFDSIQQMSISVKGDHPTLGMNLTQCSARNRLRLIDMHPGTPGSRLPKWRSILRNTYLISVQDSPITTLENLHQAIQQAQSLGTLKINCKFAVDRSYSMHPQEGIPQLYFDQLNTIAKHLQDIQSTVRQLQPHAPTTAPSKIPTPTAAPPEEPSSQAFTLKQLKQRADWPKWKQSRFKMFDQYKAQGMYSEHMALPPNANALRMLWTFQLKVDGTKKSRMVAHMNARIRNTITLGHTYANSLDTMSERLFWAIAAQEGLVVVGADVSNAFAEAPPPDDPLYLYIDEANREWWIEHLKLPPIPNHCRVVRVHNAI